MFLRTYAVNIKNNNVSTNTFYNLLLQPIIIHYDYTIKGLLPLFLPGSCMGFKTCRASSRFTTRFIFTLIYLTYKYCTSILSTYFLYILQIPHELKHEFEGGGQTSLSLWETPQILRRKSLSSWKITYFSCTNWICTRIEILTVM